MALANMQSFKRKFPSSYKRNLIKVPSQMTVSQGGKKPRSPTKKASTLAASSKQYQVTPAAKGKKGRVSKN